MLAMTVSWYFFIWFTTWLVPRDCYAEKLHYSSILIYYGQQTSRLISVLKDIGVDKCVDSCRLRQRCDGISYQRLANVCFLIQEVDDPGSLVYFHQENYISGLKSEWDVQVMKHLHFISILLILIFSVLILELTK